MPNNHEYLKLFPSKTIHLTSLNDSGEGTLRDILDKSPTDCTITPTVKGKITLDSRIVASDLRNVHFDFDGLIELTGWELKFDKCSNMYFNKFIARMGDKQVREHYKNKRPDGSSGLDCISLTACHNVLFEKCSIWSGCDENISVVRCSNIHFTSCLILFPLGDEDKLHPYGKYHCECANCSAVTDLCFHKCVMAYFRFRGPQFEANDAVKDQSVRMQALNNVIYGFDKAGTRYRSGREKSSDIVSGATYDFQLQFNLYVNPTEDGDPIVCDTSYDYCSKIKMSIRGNKYLQLNKLGKKDSCVDVKTIKDDDGKNLRDPESKQVTTKRLFTLKCTDDIDEYSLKDEKSCLEFFKEIVSNAGVGDALDIQARATILKGKKRQYFETYDDVLDFIEIK